jgi:protein-S-isoprenylcysteine O-methyltransferase Ste14
MARCGCGARSAGVPAAMLAGACFCGPGARDALTASPDIEPGGTVGVLSGSSLATWLLVLGWLPMLVGVRRAGFAMRERPPDRTSGPGPRPVPPDDPDRRPPGPDLRGADGDLESSGSRRAGAPEPSGLGLGFPGRRWVLLDVTLLLLTWLAGAGLTFFAVRRVRLAPHPWRIWAGVVLFIVGVAAWTWIRLARGTDYAQLPRAPRVLVTRGPYRVVRHPLYLATVCAGLGQLVAGATLECLVFWILLVATFAVRSAREERLLEAAFGTTWQAYVRAVPPLLPKRRTR